MTLKHSVGGGKLFELHTEYETVPEEKVDCLVDGRLVEDGKFIEKGLIPDDSKSLETAFNIQKSLKLKEDKKGDSYRLVINDRCQLVGIPKAIEEYTISGRSPLEWAVVSLAFKDDQKSGITDDPNKWQAWADEPFELIRHLRRLIYISLESTKIIKGFPKAIEENKASQRDNEVG